MCIRDREELLLRAQAPAPFTVADLEALPVNDGYRYELVAGTLIVSPSPGLAHQRVVTSLLRQLLAACPPQLEVLPGPFDVKPGGNRDFAPDILAARPADYRPFPVTIRLAGIAPGWPRLAPASPRLGHRLGRSE